MAQPSVFKSQYSERAHKYLVFLGVAAFNVHGDGGDLHFLRHGTYLDPERPISSRIHLISLYNAFQQKRGQVFPTSELLSMEF